MPKKKNKYLVIAIAFAIAAGGFIVGFWPIQIVGVLLAAFAGHPVYAVGMGILLDLAYGAPTGQLHMLLFPMTALALTGTLAHHWGRRYFFDSSAHDTI